MLVKIKTEEQLLNEGWEQYPSGTLRKEGCIALLPLMKLILGEIVDAEIENRSGIYLTGLDMQKFGDYTFPKQLIDESISSTDLLTIQELDQAKNKMKKEIGI